MKLRLDAKPRIAPLGWPHSKCGPPEEQEVVFDWVTVKPDGTGWTRGGLDNEHLRFNENELEEVLERFYETAGPYPFDFRLTVYPTQLKKSPKPKTKRAKKKTSKRGRRPTATGGSRSSRPKKPRRGARASST